MLLSDVDIVTVSNPFEHLQRDSDVEGMSDGWDAAKACDTQTFMNCSAEARSDTAEFVEWPAHSQHALYNWTHCVDSMIPPYTLVPSGQPVAMRCRYGYNDVFDDPQMGWSRYSHSIRVSVINRCNFTSELGMERVPPARRSTSSCQDHE